MVSYKEEVVEYVNSNGGRQRVTAAEVAESVGCSKDTVYRHWSAADELADADVENETETETETETDADHAGDESGQLEQGDDDGTTVEADDVEEDDDDETEQVDFEDDDAKTYECGECGGQLEYLQKECDCGAQPLWSAIEGGA